MKLIRVPWIQCRADEVNAIDCEMEWRGRFFFVMAYSEEEARKWWAGLSESERRELHGMDGAGHGDELGLF